MMTGTRCAQCGLIGAHVPGCGLAQVTGAIAGVQQAVRSETDGVLNSLRGGQRLAAAQLAVEGAAVTQLLGVNSRLDSLVAGQQALLAHHHAQAARQQYEDWLTQFLFEVETGARKVQALAGQDAFVAAWLGGTYLECIRTVQVTPASFFSIEHKRSMAHCVEMLQYYVNEANRYPNFAQLARSFRLALSAASDYQRRLGTDPDAQLQRLEEKARNVAQQAKGARLRARGWKMAAIVAGLLCLALVECAVAADDASWTAISVGGAFPLGLMAFAGAMVSYGWITTARKDEHSSREAEEMAMSQRFAIESYRSFLADAAGGQMLTWVYQEHPLLLA